MTEQVRVTHALIIATSLLIPGAAAQNVQSAGRPPITLPELTVPQERLPAGCNITPSDTVRLDGNRVESGLWTGLPIDKNPWMGTDRHVIATIRARMDGPPLTPDGPPLTGRLLAQYRLRLADGVEEAYAAVYRQAERGQALLLVYAARFSGAQAPVEQSSLRLAPENPGIVRLQTASVVVVLHGDGGQCFQAIGEYLKSVAQ
jgi:hypothetical protein